MKEEKDEGMRELMDQTLQAIPEIDIVLTERIGLLEIEHGKNKDGDYIWHFMPSNPKVQFPRDITHIYAILKEEMDKYIPDGHRVDVFPPEEAWEVKVITVVARKVGTWWSFDVDDMKRPLSAVANRISNSTAPVGKVGLS